MRNKMILGLSIVGICLLVTAGYIYFSKADKAVPPSSNTSQTSSFNKQKYSTNESSSLWVVVNKKRPLPSKYIPPDLVNINGGQLRTEAAVALSELLGAAAKDSIQMNALSPYRSYSEQQSTYNNFVARDGSEKADTYSARPGFSEHQTGLAVDLGSGTCDLDICFSDTPAGKWLAAHAHSYGFIIRYPNDKQNITGYQYEPWHLRYVGKELAAEIYKSGQVMEEFFGLPAAPSY